jgi:hypothetical protein
MPLPNKALLVLTLLFASLLPLPSQALSIMVCSPSCTGPGADPSPTLLGPGQATTDPVTGITTTVVTIAGLPFKQFTIDATIASEQSGTLQRITFNPTTITANVGSACSVLAPCQLEIMATSDACDFPTPKPVGGYPAGAFMSGVFFGNQPASPDGDSISVTGEAGGVNRIAGTACGTTDPSSTDIINLVPGTGPANTGTSLPSECSGNLSCKFIATALSSGFYSQLTKTVQQVCIDQTSCLTRLRTRLNVAIKTEGNSVLLPLAYATANPDPANPGINPTVQLLGQGIPAFAGLNVGKLGVGPDSFALTAQLQVDPQQNIDPSAQEVFLRVGNVSVVIPAGRFTKLLQGTLFTFFGTLNGQLVAAAFQRSSATSPTWLFAAAVDDVLVTGLARPPLQVPVELVVGRTAARGLVTATFF